jgi:hypothetical protein
MNKLLAAALPILGLALASSPAFARVTTFSGNGCTPTNDSINCATPGQWGMGNACSTAVTVVCPLTLAVPVGGSVPLTDITFWAFDRSGTDDVYCDIHMTDTSGSDVFTFNRASTNGGNRAAVYSESVSFSPVSTNGSPMFATCHIPGSTSSGFSHLVTIKVTTND